LSSYAFLGRIGVSRSGIVETLAVGEDHAEQRAQLEQLMPVAVVAGQP